MLWLVRQDGQVVASCLRAVRVDDAGVLLELATQPGVVDRERPDDLLVEDHVASEIFVDSPRACQFVLQVPTESGDRAPGHLGVQAGEEFVDERPEAP